MLRKSQSIPQRIIQKSKAKQNHFQNETYPSFPKKPLPFNRVEFIGEGQNISPQVSKYQSTPYKKTDLPNNGQRFDREENDLSST